ncbi:MAG: phosphotransferase [Acidobacteria bacterium]|nr:phosphotransferase [Acidobacteriota bacterium]
MRKPLFSFPDAQALMLVFDSIFNSSRSPRRRVNIVSRKPNAYTSYHPSELVGCRFDDGSRLTLLVKYWVGPTKDRGHPIGPGYEAKVYRRVLQPLGCSTPQFFGAHNDPETGATWLIIEYLEDGVYPNKTLVQLASLGLTARWIGQFHAANQARWSSPSLSFLHRYDAPYYLQWARSTAQFEAGNARRHSWLSALYLRYEEAVDFLLSKPATVIHGDYYADNTLIFRGAIRPIDWENASIAAGEIDLASFTNGWHWQAVQACELEYQQGRWPEGAPADFKRTLDCARLFVLFRLLGEAQNWPDAGMRRWRFRQLRSVCKRLGFG